MQRWAPLRKKVKLKANNIKICLKIVTVLQYFLVKKYNMTLLYSLHHTALVYNKLKYVFLHAVFSKNWEKRWKSLKRKAYGRLEHSPLVLVLCNLHADAEGAVGLRAVVVGALAAGDFAWRWCCRGCWCFMSVCRTIRCVCCCSVLLKGLVLCVQMLRLLLTCAVAVGLKL